MSRFQLVLVRALPAIALASTCGAATAQDSPASVEDLDSIVVTATRTAQTQDETLASVSVVERGDIERLQPASMPDLLRGLPGVSIANSGGPGKQASLFLRGTESDHVLVVIDGVRVGSATAGITALQDIPVEQIERIELVRGPFSSLYGSEAIGGVLQVFTRRPKGSFAPQASVSLGSDGFHRESLGFSGRGEHGWGSLVLAHEETDGFDSCRGFGAPLFVGCFADEPDRDGYRNDSATLRGGVSIGDALELEAHALAVDARVDFDGFYNGSLNRQRVYGTRVAYAASDAITLNARVSRSDDLTDNFSNDVFMTNFDTRRDQASLQADVEAGPGLLTMGYDWLRDRVDSTEAFAVESRVRRALFGQWQQGFGKHALQASLRRDDDDQFGGQTTGSALWGLEVTDALRLTASYGTAFKAPTFNDLYYPFSGNPDLQPETSRSFELGLRGELANGDWRVNAFQTDVDDLIVFDSGFITPGTPFGAPRNIEQARIRGVELSGNTTLAGWTLAGSASWIDARNETSGVFEGNDLPRRAPRTARIDLDRSFDAASLGATVAGASGRYDNAANSTRMGGYGTTDLRFGYRFTPAWQLQFALRNVFDKRYETVAYYNQSGREWQATLRYSPK